MTPLLAMSHSFAGPRLLQRPFTAASRPCRCPLGVRAQAEGKEGAGGVVNEELLAKLKQAELEAARLKAELAAAKAETQTAAPLIDAKPVRRIDSGDLRRETLFTTESKQRNWLNESDVNFFTGGGPTELGEGGGASSEEEKGVVQRRLLLGLAGTVALGAFALVPTEKLQPPPSKPLFFYLVPLLRVQELLREAEAVVPEGDYAQVQSLVRRIESYPNNLQDNLRSAAALLPDRRQVDAALALGRDVYELVEQIDYNRYFDSMGAAEARGGKALQRYYDFSLQSARSAQAKLSEFLRLMPREQLEAAQQQVDTLPF